MGPIDYSKFALGLSTYRSSIDFIDLKHKLLELKVKFAHIDYVNYIDRLAGDLENIITADQIEIEVYKNKFDAILKIVSKCTAKTKKKCGRCSSCHSRKFSNSIQKILDYRLFVPKLIESHAGLNFKTCYICNAQYAITVSKDHRNKRNIAKYQFDHVLPKSRYPCFSISFYNLLPICANCNSIKLHYDLGVNFHNTLELEGAFKFKLNDISLLKYLKSPVGKNIKLEIELSDSYKYLRSYQGKKLSDKFDLVGIYNTQNDLIEEQINRKLRYSEVYKNTLNTSFPEIFKNTSIDERILLGTYLESEGIHRRPMSKFLQDIDQQLEKYFQSKLPTKS